MIALLQRVQSASVTVDENIIATIGVGLCVLVGVQQADTEQSCNKLVDKLLGYRVFPDEEGRMNLDVLQHKAQLLLVPQFTLAADTTQGRRPGFSTAAKPDEAKMLFDTFCQRCAEKVPGLQTGSFGADMQVALINDGPVTFWLET